MDIFDNALNKAKEVFEVAYSKTSEVVSVQKQKFDIASIEAKREKDFAELGKICYNSIVNEEANISSDKALELVKEIEKKNKTIEALKKDIDEKKHERICPACASRIENDAAFCKNCGAKLEFDSEEET